METKDFTVSLVVKMKKTPIPLFYTEETEPEESFELLPVAEYSADGKPFQALCNVLSVSVVFKEIQKISPPPPEYNYVTGPNCLAECVR